MSAANQMWDPDAYQTHAGYVPELGAAVLKLLQPVATERVLDLGCGDGVLTRTLMDHKCDVVGVDASEDMVNAARQRGVDARLQDGAELTFSAEFDAVLSNAALHWIKPPEAVIAGVWRALKPGGRFVAEFGGEGNVATIIDSVQGALARRGIVSGHPWFFPSPHAYRQQLEAAGFVVEQIEHFKRPTPLPGDISGWLLTFAQPLLSPATASQQAEITSEVVSELRPRLTDASGVWQADYVRLRFKAVKPAECTRPNPSL